MDLPNHLKAPPGLLSALGGESLEKAQSFTHPAVTAEAHFPTPASSPWKMQDPNPGLGRPLLPPLRTGSLQLELWVFVGTD